jgi:acetoin utilization deacetylase AcuC-like enzyme
LPVGTGDAGYLECMERVVVPVVDRFAPEMILIAAGQDASTFDPNGRQCLTMDGFHRLGQVARALAERHAAGRLVLVQEGGYAPSYAAFCLHATMEGVLGTPRLLGDPLAFLPDDLDRASGAILAVRSALGRSWAL